MPTHAPWYLRVWANIRLGQRQGWENTTDAMRVGGNERRCCARTYQPSQKSQPTINEPSSTRPLAHDSMQYLPPPRTSRCCVKELTPRYATTWAPGKSSNYATHCGLLWMWLRIIIVEYCACRRVENCQCDIWHWPRKFCRLSVMSVEITGSSSFAGAS
jgi:hypothetical protein